LIYNLDKKKSLDTLLEGDWKNEKEWMGTRIEEINIV
jgi:hypothetical protein